MLADSLVLQRHRSLVYIVFLSRPSHEGRVEQRRELSPGNIYNLCVSDPASKERERMGGREIMAEKTSV